MAIVKNLNKQSGVTYVYESKSYWDPDLKAPRSHRTLIGKIMPGTTEMIPTGKKGGTREKKSVQEKEAAWKARKAQEKLEKVAEAALEGTLDYKALYEETQKSYETQMAYKDRQLQELKKLVGEQGQLLVTVSTEITELLAKTKKILFSLEDDT